MPRTQKADDARLFSCIIISPMIHHEGHMKPNPAVKPKCSKQFRRHVVYCEAWASLSRSLKIPSLKPQAWAFDSKTLYDF